MAENINENANSIEFDVDLKTRVVDGPKTQRDLEVINQAYTALLENVKKLEDGTKTAMSMDAFNSAISQGAGRARMGVEEFARIIRDTSRTINSKMLPESIDQATALARAYASVTRNVDAVHRGIEKITGVNPKGLQLLDKETSSNIVDYNKALTQLYELVPKIDAVELDNVLGFGGLASKHDQMALKEYTDGVLNLRRNMSLIAHQLNGLSDEGEIGHREVDDTGLILRNLTKVKSALDSIDEAAKRRHDGRIYEYLSPQFAEEFAGQTGDIPSFEQWAKEHENLYGTYWENLINIAKEGSKRFKLSQADAYHTIMRDFTEDLDKSLKPSDFVDKVDTLLADRVQREADVYKKLEQQDYSKYVMKPRLKKDFNVETQMFDADDNEFMASSFDKRVDIMKQRAEARTKEWEDLGKHWGEAIVTAQSEAMMDPEKLRVINMGSLGEYGKTLAEKTQDYADKAFDSSFVANLGEKLKSQFGDISKDITSDADRMSLKLQRLYSKIPETVTRTTSGSVVNTVALDANNAYAKVRELISELRELPSALNTTAEYNALAKQAESLAKKYEEASKTRDRFVVDTDATSMDKYNTLQRQIEEQTDLRNAIDKRLGYLRSEKEKYQPGSEPEAMNVEIKSLTQRYKAAESALVSLEKRQQNLLQNSAIAANKSTYESYTTKMIDLKMQLEEVTSKMHEMEEAGTLTNSAQVAEQYETLMSRIKDGMDSFSMSVQGANREHLALKKTAQELTEKYRGIEVPKGIKKTDSFKELEKQYRSAYKSLQTLADLQQKYIQNGTSFDSKSWKNLAIDIDNAKKKLAEYDELMEKAISEGSAFTSKGGGFGPGSFTDWLTGKGKISWDDLITKPLNNGAKAFGSTMKKELKAISGLINKITGGIKNWFKNQKSLSDNAKQMYKTFTSYLSMLRTRIRRKFISMVFEDLQTNIGKVAQMSPRFNKALSEFIVSTKTLGAQIVTAFEPLATRVLPLLTKFVDYLAYAADQMAQFISKLMGDDTYIKATKGQYDYAASLDETTGKTKKATKAAKEYENTVLSFDQLHKLNGNNSGDDDDLGFDATDLKNMEDAANSINDIAEKIHNAFANGDYFGAGQAIAEAVNGWFSWLKDVAGWEANSEKFTRWMDHAIDVANGFVDGWDSIGNGEAIGDISNTLINLADQVFSPDSEVGFHFEEAGRKLGETFISAMLTIDWTKAGSALVNGIQALPRFINGILKSQVAVGKEGTVNAGVLFETYVDDKTGELKLIDTDEVVDETQYELKTIGEALGDGLKEMFTSAIKTFTPATWSDMISGLINEFFRFIEATFSNPESAAELGTKLGQLFNETFEKLDAKQIAGGINAFTESFNSFVEAALYEADLSAALGKLGEIAKNVNLGPLAETLGVIFAPAIIMGLVSGLATLIKGGVKWAFISGLLGSAGKGGSLVAALAGVGEVLGGIALALAAIASACQFIYNIKHPEVVEETMQKNMDKVREDPEHHAAIGGIMAGRYGTNLLFPQVYTDKQSDGTGLFETAMKGAMGVAVNDYLMPKIQEVKDALVTNADYSAKDYLSEYFGSDSTAYWNDGASAIAAATAPAEGTLAATEAEDFTKNLAKEITTSLTDALATGKDPVVNVMMDSQQFLQVMLKGYRQYNKTHNPYLSASMP